MIDMSLNEKLKKLRDVLSELDIDVYHYDALNASSEYIVWYESGESDALSADNRKGEQVLAGTIDLFTRKEYNQIVDDIQDRLNKNKISFRLNSVQYEDETKLIHYEWEFEI